MLIQLFGIVFIGTVRGDSDIVRSKVQRAEGVQGDFAVETEALKADGGDLLAALVEGVDLRATG